MVCIYDDFTISLQSDLETGQFHWLVMHNQTGEIIIDSYNVKDVTHTLEKFIKSIKLIKV